MVEGYVGIHLSMAYLRAAVSFFYAEFVHLLVPVAGHARHHHLVVRRHSLCVPLPDGLRERLGALKHARHVAHV
jgi:hypothetical protein